MTRSHALRLALLLALAGAGCAGVVELRGVDAGDRRTAGGGAGGRPALATDSVPRRIGLARPDAPHPAAPRERVVCRGDRSAGWIAIAYLPGDGCPRVAGDATHTAAIVVPLAGQPAQATLDVCADERVPRDWQVEARAFRDAAGRCPGAAPDGRSAVVRIRRVR